MYRQRDRQTTASPLVAEAIGIASYGALEHVPLSTSNNLIFPVTGDFRVNFIPGHGFLNKTLLMFHKFCPITLRVFFKFTL